MPVIPWITSYTNGMNTYFLLLYAVPYLIHVDNMEAYLSEVRLEARRVEKG